ncbi:MAG: enoyl-CoA hydratase/isomerase family protein [Saprospiraceae bacterium]
MENKPNGYVKTQIQANIARVTFAHPSHNALPAPLLEKLVATFQKLDKNEAVRVIVLQSGGDRTFCAGASFDELLAIKNGEKGQQFFLGFANVINAMRTCSKLIIGKVQGKAVGGGVGLAAATDYCLATKYAAIRLSELAIGIGPFVIEPAVSRKIGQGATAELSIGTAWKDAQWALQKGLYAEVFEDGVQLEKAVQDLAERLRKSNPEAATALKKIFWQGTDHWDELLPQRAAISGQLVLSDFTKQALEAFKNKE